MNREEIEKKLENLEEFIRQIYVDQMVRKDYVIGHAEYKKIGKMFSDIYSELDKEES